MGDTKYIDILIAKLRDVFPFPKEKDWDNGYDCNKKDGWHLAGIMKTPKDCLEIMIGVCEGIKADTGTSNCTIDSVMPRFLPIEEVAKLYGQSISYKWLSPDGNDWLDKKGKVTANTIREMEQGSIKNVLNGA